jgi:hypothetical protein
MTKPATTTPDPEFNIPGEDAEPKQSALKEGQASPPPPSDPAQAQAPQTPGGGGAPGTGD